ncbi:MAG: Rne/Rng family ribonuclease [Rikenellaceae bacterium]
MNKELIVQGAEDMIHIALLEDKTLVEYHKVERVGGYSVGDIYLGKVRKTMPGLNAAFVNIGHKKDAFLHRLDLGLHYKSMSKFVNEVTKKKKEIDFEKFDNLDSYPTNVKITEILGSGDTVLVQVIKEAISTKGPRVTTELSLTGRYVVLLPMGNKVAVSQKIRKNFERRRLRRAVLSALPENFGAIVRTASVGAESEDIEADVKMLAERWHEIVKKIEEAANPSLILSEDGRVNTILRDILSDEFSHVHIDDNEIFEEIKEYIKVIAPEKEKIVKLYKGSSVSIFDNFDVTRQIKGGFGKLIPFKRKAYMIVEHTEALHVIDINSGTRLNNATSQEETALEVNLNAVPHIARQLRLRDMGGIIVVDFIDMRKKEHKEALLEAMRKEMGNDRAKHTILPLSRFGLMQITRHRVRPETKIAINETCPACHGTGEISPSILFDAQIENKICALKEDEDARWINIKVHPYLAAYINKGLFSLRMKWMWKYKCYISVIPDESVGYVDAKYFGRQGYEFSSGSIFDYDENDVDADVDDENEYLDAE